MLDCSLIIIFAFILDLVLGDPVYKFHPVRLMGITIAFCEDMLFRVRFNNIFGGAFLSIFVNLFFSFVYVTVFILLEKYFSVYISYVFSVYIVYSCISLKDLLKHANNVVSELNFSLEKGRNAVQMLVGRNATLLDKKGIIKATVESIAESFVDGVLSPIFCFFIGSVIGIAFGVNPAVLGVVCMIIQRSTNTIDSMIGYKNLRYINFGTVGARLDDILNFIPARLSIFIIAFASAILKLNYCECLKIAFRDRLKHASPNSAHSEAAVAGALGIQLGGPTIYMHGTVDKPFLGDSVNDIKLLDILIVGRLIKISSIISILLFCLLMLTILV
jgi:adenosylcobinamide-phosphate synthase